VVKEPYEHLIQLIRDTIMTCSGHVATQFYDVEILFQVVDFILAQVLAAAKCTIYINSQKLESQLDYSSLLYLLFVVNLVYK